MAKANILFRNDFNGVGYPTFEQWPSFSWPSGNPALAKPVVDGRGYGISNRYHYVLWRGRESRSPGRADFKADITAIWSNAGFAGDREIAILLRFKDYNNWLALRLRSMGTASPELRLFKCVAGVETQLSSTYTGSPISATQLNAGVTVRARVEDLTDGTGNTSLKAYVDPEGLSGNGTLAISYEGDLSAFRGTQPIGIELGDECGINDVRIDSLVVMDFADEWTAPAPIGGAAATGWQVEIGGTLYNVDDDTGGLENLDPPITLMSVNKKYGLSGGNNAVFRIGTDTFDEGILRINRKVRVWHDGDIRHDGFFTSSSHNGAPAESQTWTSKSITWLASEIVIEDDDCAGQIRFNISEPEDDAYDASRQNYTVGAIITWLMDRYLSAMQAKGCAPSDGDNAYVTEELQTFSAVLPDVTVSGSLLGAIEQLLTTWYPNYKILVDPDTRIWHFVDITNLTGEDIALTSEHATVSYSANPEIAKSAILFRGVRRENADDITLSLSDKAWTGAQGNAWDKDKRHRTGITVPFVSAGEGEDSDGLGLVYVDIPTGHLDENDFRGAIASVTGDGYERWCVSHTSSRIYMSAPLWGGGSPPSSGTVTLNLVHPSAIPALSAAGVGRAFFAPIAIITGCGGGAKGNAFRNQGFCGSASVTTTGTDGATYSQQYQYKLHFMSAEQSNAGFCAPLVELSEKPKPPIGWANYLPPAGGSPPIDPCARNDDSQPQVSIGISLPSVEDCMPKLRIPTEGWYGPVFSEDDSQWSSTDGEPSADDWGIERELTIDLVTYTDPDTQDDDLAAAGAEILKYISQKPYAFTVTLATPWVSHWNGVLRAPPSATDTWASLDRRITLSSSERTTGWESTTQLPVYEVTWKIPENVTVLGAGTAQGWIGGDYGNIARKFSERDGKLQAARLLKELEDFRNRTLAKPPDRVGGMQAGPIPACDVTHIDGSMKRVVNVNTKLDQGQKVAQHNALAGLARELIDNGVEPTNAGSWVDVPGVGHDEQIVDGVPRSLADHRIPFMGPVDHPNGDIGKYGGLPGSQDEDAGDTPIALFRVGNYLLRKKPNPLDDDTSYVGLQVSSTDSDGMPTGWTDFTSAMDFPDIGRAPLSSLNHLSIQHQLWTAVQANAAKSFSVLDENNEIPAAGDVSTDYPDGAPADVKAMIIAGAFSNDLEVVRGTINDPGGLVFYGPVSRASGADAEKYWRVITPENLLVEVARTGGGANGSPWADVDNGDGSNNFLSRAYICHKQIHASSTGEFHQDIRQPGAISTLGTGEPTNPFGAGEDQIAFDSMNMSGAAFVLPVPEGATGIPSFFALVKEDPLVPLPAMTTLTFQIDWSYQASPWTTPGIGSTQTLITDGTGTGTGQFRQPGGSVPPGLRAVSGSIISNNSMPGSTPLLGGAGVDIAIVEGGVLARITEAVDVTEVWTNTSPGMAEVATVSDVWTRDITKAITETCAASDSWLLELNPVADVEDEDLYLAESVAVSDEWTLEIL